MKFWPAAVCYAAIVNTQIKTNRFEGLIKIFGARCFYIEAHEQRGKQNRYEAISKPGIFIGINPVSEEYRIFTAEGKIVHTHWSAVRVHEYSIFQKNENMCKAFRTLDQYYTGAGGGEVIESFNKKMTSEIDERMERSFKEMMEIRAAARKDGTQDDGELSDSDADENMCTIYDASDSDSDCEDINITTLADTVFRKRGDKIVKIVNAPRATGPFFIDADNKEWTGWGKSQALLECADENGHIDWTDYKKIGVMTIRSFKPLEEDDAPPDLGDIRMRSYPLKKMADAAFEAVCELIPENAKMKTRTVVLGY